MCMSTGPASLDLTQLVTISDRLHITIPLIVIGILAAVNACVSSILRTWAEGVGEFYACRAKCAEARERFARLRKPRSISKPAKKPGRPDNQDRSRGDSEDPSP